MKRPRLVQVSLALLTSLLGACSSGDPADDSSGDPNADALRKKHHHPDAGVPDSAGGDGGGGAPDGGVPDAPSGDGTAERLACKSQTQLGSALGGTFGRLDGRLVSLVPPGTSGCPSDAHHLHLQVVANGGTYDIAVNISDKFGGLDYFLERDLAMNLSFSEGWHSASLDYPTLGVHSGDFAPESEADMLATLQAAMANTNHISIFMTPYGPDGGHDIHRHLNGTDGAIVLDPLASVSHVLMFHFDNQSF